MCLLFEETASGYPQLHSLWENLKECEKGLEAQGFKRFSANLWASDGKSDMWTTTCHVSTPDRVRTI